ncbi:Uncharacterised protein [Vibrio cholerae]|nr:Uncharacterised protein [Vibrio cholerae]
MHRLRSKRIGSRQTLREIGFQQRTIGKYRLQREYVIRRFAIL